MMEMLSTSTVCHYHKAAVKVLFFYCCVYFLPEYLLAAFVAVAVFLFAIVVLLVNSLVMSPALRGHFGIAQCIHLSVPWRSCLGYRHSGWLQFNHRRPPEMCGLRTCLWTDVDPPQFFCLIGGETICHHCTVILLGISSHSEAVFLCVSLYLKRMWNFLVCPEYAWVRNKWAV